MLSRRRFLSIAASAAALPLLSPALAAPPQAVIWRGTVMGGLASMTLVHPDRRHALRLRDRALAEIERLERIFSLYRADSALVRLNEEGQLQEPPLELVELLGFSLHLARQSGGAFDPSVQPLFRLYLEHFMRHRDDPAGPPAGRIEAARALVGYPGIELAAGRIRLARRGMALTLNGIAQGFVTDRVAALLRAGGMENLLLDLGEIRAAGRHPQGRPWQARIAGRAAGRIALDADLPALATSAARGTLFEPSGRHHHLLDPATGRSAPGRQAVSVAAPSATLADGLSTTLAILAPARRKRFLAAYPAVRVFLTGPDGRDGELSPT